MKLINFIKVNFKLINIYLAVIASIVSFFLGFKCFSNNEIEGLYVKWVYYSLIVNIILWSFALVNTKTKSFISIVKNYWKKHKVALILSLVLVILGSFFCKPDFRVLADETNLLSMSQALYENRECKNYTSILYYYYGFKNIVDWEVDKRPALFPLAVSFCHSLFGYRPENIFLANMISAFLVLIVFYHLMSYKFGRFWGNCALIILAAYPLFVLYYNSGGFEIFNLLFILILLLLYIKFLQKPTALNTEVLLLFLPLLGQTRYESVFAVICILPTIFIMLPKAEYFKFSYKLYLMPFFYIPIVWIRLLTDNLRGLQAEDRGEAFSFENFKINLNDAWHFFIGENLAYGVIPIITFLAIACFLYFFVNKIYEFIKFLLKKQTDSDNKVKEKKTIFKSSKARIIFFVATFIFYLFHAIIRLAYWGGRFSLQTSSRLALIFIPILIYYAIKFCYSIRLKFKINKYYFAICFLSLLFIYFPVAGQNLGVRDLVLYREFRTAREFLENNYPDKKDYILVADRCNMYVPFKYNAINFGFLNNRKDEIKRSLNNRTYTYAIVIQLIDKDTNTPTSDCKVTNNIKMFNLYESQITASQFLRISHFTYKDIKY